MKLLFFVIIFNFYFIASAVDPQVSIPSGTLVGRLEKSFSGRIYSAFEGIPYARPPVGKYRFREPQPVKPWRSTWVANTTHKCLQYDHFVKEHINKVQGQEDCLYLNVYSPQLSQTALLDVVVHIHGGAFMFGHPREYGPNYLLDYDVVYVNLNYRLGPLGFLSTEDDVVPGNNGLKDQNMALQWIKNNIQYFGGNPNSITLTGLSAGGASVTYHMMSEMSQGLFHKAVAMSGVALSPWALTEASLEKAKKLAASVGCPTVTSKEMVECMRYRPAKQIVENVSLFLKFLYNPFSPFGPVVEKVGINTPFLSENPYLLLRNGLVQDMPLLISAVQAEGLYPGGEFLSDPSYLPTLNRQWNEFAPFILDYNYTADAVNQNEISQKALNYYLKGQEISEKTFDRLIKMLSDRLFIVSIETAAKLYAKKATTSVYFYYFNYRGSVSKSKILSGRDDNIGVCHADDGMHVFSNTWHVPQVEASQDDKDIMKILANVFVSFAKTGIPEVSGVKFDPMEKQPGPYKYLQINSPKDIAMKTIDTLGNRQFWNSLPINENQILVHMKDEL